MADSTQTKRFRFWRRLIRFIGVIVPRRFRARFRQEWEAELEHREELLARWDRLDWRNKLELLWRSLGAFWDALWLQQLRWEDEMIQDLRFGVRMLLKHKGFTIVAVLTLALGIGANTAIFSVMNALLLRSLPVKDPEELVLLASVNRSGPAYTFSYPLYELLRDGSHNFPDLFGFTDVSKRRMSAGGTEAELIRGQEVTGNFFAALGAPALLGRTLTPEDDRVSLLYADGQWTPSSQAIAVISHSFWQRRFGADSAVVGKTINIENWPVTIVGVTAPGFFGIQPGEHPDLWVLVRQVWFKSLDKPGRSFLHLMGRLPAGPNRAQAQAELDLVYQRHKAEYLSLSPTNWDESERQIYAEKKLELQPGAGGYTELRLKFRRSLMLLMMAVGLVLLIACANVASLLLARAAARGHEFTMRSALGAGRLRLVRQMLTESLLLAALGGASGLLISQWGVKALLVFMRLQSDPISFSVTPDARVLWFTLAATLLTGLLFGLGPALRSSRLDLATALKGAGGGVAGDASRQRLNQALVVAQVALSLLLLIGAGLFVRTLQKLKAADAGFNREHVVVFNLDFTQNMRQRLLSLYKELAARLETLPGVRAAGVSSEFVLGRNRPADRITTEGYAARPDEDLACYEFYISPRFFEAMGTPILSGRGFEPQDEIPANASNASNPLPAVINQAMARRYFGDDNPLGRRFYSVIDPQQKYEIVGVVKDVRLKSLREPSPPTYYLPYIFDPGHDAAFVLRTMSAPGAMAASLRQVAQEVDPTIRVRDVRSLDDVVNASLHQERVLAQLGGFLSIFALALACLGLYGVLSFSVAQRTREIGVRMALGAQRKDVLSLVVGRGLKLTSMGLALGFVAALAVTRFVSSLLYGVTATDPVTFAGVSLLILLVAGLASWLPARRATKLDPITVLRHE
ncbi:MAG TPA: ABC transporter permease [Blastocatellia bacterium]|nr:ABC transporter permease [Blastocatellia bacterium]